MGLNFRKSIKVGPARINLSKSGVGYSIGAGGLRYTKSPKRKKKKEQQSSLGPIGYLLGLILAIIVLMALAAAVYTLFLRFKWVFITIGILALAGVIVFFIIKTHKGKQLEGCDE